MSATEIQQQRMKDYFKEAAKEILRGEGLKVASARNIAERAGYSYATLYNYFDDLPSLIFECVTDFQAEIDELTAARIAGESGGAEKLKAGITAWVNYFVQYPGIFELFFLERIGAVGNRKDIADTIYNSIVPSCNPGLALLEQEGAISASERGSILDSLRFQLTGLMLYYSNRKNPEDYGGLMQILNRIIEQITG